MRIFLIKLLLGIARLLLDIVSILLAEEEAHRCQYTARTEPPDAPSIDTTMENLQENVGVVEAETPENEIWIMEYPTNQSLYSSSNTLSDDSLEETEEEVIPTLEALWANWNPEPDQIDYPDRPTTPGILETTLANDTDTIWPVSEIDEESNQPESHRSDTPDGIECIFNPTGSRIPWFFGPTPLYFLNAGAMYFQIPPFVEGYIWTDRESLRKSED
ncbi:uncharacterized protein ARB_07272 [Trichophyton benhamiae CBS 112371]|uniref:Uncharacterized protein n=1 Tax=Arthroderma benhamiae (strain ATCC MYA-4681 / CBS 112371) TaxID=663331 RepID=D4ASQ7_ARTBC|nr:uncharacterized protein ARB_07272 [Trichophyton benhamiae CBS 112371]EFE33807.1 hypothetical protein ARB_07272 [Trichophyton benhamiae CBS 112371]